MQPFVSTHAPHIMGVYTCNDKEDIYVSMARMCRKLEAGTHMLVTIELRMCMCMRPSACTLRSCWENLHISSHINNVNCNITLVCMCDNSNLGRCELTCNKKSNPRIHNSGDPAQTIVCGYM